MTYTYAAKFNRRARQWDVVDQTGLVIVAMFGGGKRGQAEAENYAAYLTRWAS